MSDPCQFVTPDPARPLYRRCTRCGFGLETETPPERIHRGCPAAAVETVGRSPEALAARIKTAMARQLKLAPEALSVAVEARIRICCTCQHLRADRLFCSRIRDCHPREAWFEKLLEYDCLIFSGV